MTSPDRFLPGTTVRRSLMVRSLELKKATNGNPYFSGELFDKSGTYRCTIWNGVAAIDGNASRPGDVIDATWKVKEFNGVPQLDVERLHNAIPGSALSEADVNAFIRSGAVMRSDWLAFYREHVEDLIEHDSIRRIIAMALDDERFWRAAAAKTMHQNWRGGLAEHTHRILRMFLGLLKAGHPTIDDCVRGLVIAGIILHDYGKIFEYEEIAPGQFEVSRWGHMMGHLAGGPIYLAQRMMDESEAVHFESDELRMHFFHVLLAHHGEVEWGSPITPKTREALIVHFLDNLDGKLSMVEEAGDMGKCRGLDGNAIAFKL